MMNRIKIAICMNEGEYLTRLSGCLMNHYRSCLEIHIFTELEQIGLIASEEYQGFLISDFDLEEHALKEIPKDKIIYLGDIKQKESMEVVPVILDRYEEVPSIVDAIGILVGDKESFLKTGDDKVSHCKLFGVYSLNAAQLQLPFVIMLGNILAEKQRVLVVDLQENSGLSQLGETENQIYTENTEIGSEVLSGMEDVMSMADSKKYTKARLISAIRHYRQWDYIYPVRNSECICEGNYNLYKSMLQIIEQEMRYDVVIINFGVRFQGFFRLISDCKECYFLGEGNKRTWREKSFYEELHKREDEISSNVFVRMEMSTASGVSFSAERLADQWLWNEQGDLLRKILGRECSCG